MEDKEELAPLKAKQEAFAQEYVKDYNGTQAAIRAGYSKDTAAVIASENLRKPKIDARIQELRKEIYKRNQVSIDEVIAGLGDFFRLDLGEIFNEDGSVKEIADLSDRARKAIKNIKIQEYTYDDGSKSEKRTIELYDKLSAAEKLLKHFGGYEVDNAQKSANITIFELPDNGREVEE